MIGCRFGVFVGFCGVFGCFGWGDEEDDFAFGFVGGEVLEEFGRGAVVEGFKCFGEFAGNADGGVG